MSRRNFAGSRDGAGLFITPSDDLREIVQQMLRRKLIYPNFFLRCIDKLSLCKDTTRSVRVN